MGFALLACRCMAHSLNLAAKYVLEALASTPRHVLAKGKKDSHAAKPAAADVDQDDIESDEEEEEPNENEFVNFNPNDLLGKAHAFVTQACPHFSQRPLLFLTAAIRRCASLHKPAHSSPNNALQPKCLSLSLSSGVAHDGRQQTI
jgi:hypothetical protein